MSKYELFIKKPNYMNGVYAIVQPFKKMVYVGETNNIYRRISEHINCIYGKSKLNEYGYGSNSNLVQEDDKRLFICPVYENNNTYKKRGFFCEENERWIYDETIFMYLFVQKGYTLYNSKNDNTGKERFEAIKKNTIKEYLINKFKDYKKEDEIENDIALRKEIFESFIGEYKLGDDSVNWNELITNDNNSFQYLKDKVQINKYAAELSGKVISKDTIESCGVKTIDSNTLSEWIKEKKFETTIFSPVGDYLNQSLSTILATKIIDINNHMLVSDNGNYEIVSTKGAESGFCSWALKKLDVKDTREFLESSDKGNHSNKYVFFTYTSSEKKAGNKNDINLNPQNYETFQDFKDRVYNYLNSSDKYRYGNRIRLSKNSSVELPDSLFPEIIEKGNNRTLLVSNIYVVDGFVNDIDIFYEYFWRHYKEYSVNGEECECHLVDRNYYPGKEYKEAMREVKIEGNVYEAIIEKEQPIDKEYNNSKCARMKNDKRDEFARRVIDPKTIDKDNEYRNLFVAELVYPYIADIKYVEQEQSLVK